MPIPNPGFNDPNPNPLPPTLSTSIRMKEEGIRGNKPPKFCTIHLHWLERGEERCSCGLLKVAPGIEGNEGGGKPS